MTEIPTPTETRAQDQPRVLETATFVVVNWNLAPLTTRCVRALIDDDVPEARIVLVDNGSADGSAERLKRDLPSCQHVSLPDNVGYARGSNAGARALPGEAYVFVNSDAFAHRSGSAASLVDAVRRDGIGIAVPKLLNEDLTLQRNVVPMTGLANSLVRATGLSRFIPNRWQPEWSTYWDHSHPREIQCATGAVIAVAGALWEAVGGFPEQLLMYGEELYLFARASRLGWRARFIDESEFVHLGNASGERLWTQDQRAGAMGEAEAFTLQAILGRHRARATVAIIALGLVGRLVFYLMTGNTRSAAGVRSYLSGQLRGLRSAPGRLEADGY